MPPQVPFGDRGDRADDALAALRACLSRPLPEYHGRYYRISGMVVNPCALQDPVPLWIGGRSERSLRRAVELGDAWTPVGLRAAYIADLLARARRSPAWAAHAHPLQVVLQTGRPVNPAGDPDGARRAVDRLVAAGATGVQLRFVHRSPAHLHEQLDTMSGLVDLDRP